MDGHLGFDLEAARQHRIGFDEREREGAVAGHDIGDVRVEQAIDGITHETVAEVVERTLVLLEVGGAQSIADHHVVAFENLIHHGGSCVRGIGVVTIRHDVHVGVDVFKHGANHVALALTWFLADNRSLGCRDFGGAVGGVVVVYVDIGIRQCYFEIAYYFADGDFLVITGEKHCDSWLSFLVHGISV